MAQVSQVDVRKICAALNVRLPEPVLRLLALLIHQRELNKGLARIGHLHNIAFVNAALRFLNVQQRIHGEDFLQGLERPVLVSNHPLGALDGLVLISLLAGHFGKVRLLVNDLLMYIHQLEEIFVPVNKLAAGRHHLQSCHELFSTDAAILHFPAGLCSRRRGGRLRDLPWNRSYVRLCRDTGRPIVPCFFAGENSRFFYELANLRRRLGIGFNIEMLFLVHEMFRKRGSTLEVFLGRPISPETLHRGDISALNRQIRRTVYALPTTQTSAPARTLSPTERDGESST